ncbi:25308_t:CDS:2, partial [Racocetra persica]
AIKWTKIAWIVSPYDENGVSIIPPITYEGIDDMEENLSFDPNDELAVKELQQQINILHVRNLIPIEDLLNLEEEQEVHHQFTDENLIHTATEIEQIKDKFVVPP